MPLFDHQDKSSFLNGRDRTRPLVPIVSPSLMVADQAQLLRDASYVLQPAGGSVEWLHVDVIDGHFAPNFSFCADTVAALRRHLPHAFLDCHLMVTNPEEWVEVFARAGASGYVFHVEATSQAARLCRRVRAAGMQAGVALKPSTPVEVVLPLVEAGEVDMALIMTVEPGFAAQRFMPQTVTKVQALRRRYAHLNIQVDGSINRETIREVAEAGANVVVLGQAAFKTTHCRDNVDFVRRTIQEQLNRSTRVHL